MALEWSNSSDWLLRQCRRRFWFQKVLASPRSKWGSERREANILGNVQSLDLWRGNVVHDVVGQYVLGRHFQGRVPTEDQAVVHAVDTAREQLRFSSSRSYREENMTKSKADGAYLALWEDEFGPEDPVEFERRKEQALEEIEQGVRGFYRNDRAHEVLCNARWSEWEVRLRSTDFASECGVPVVGRADLIAVGADGVTVVDWKVGHNHQYDHAPQLWTYATLLGEVNRYQGGGGYAYRPLPGSLKTLPKRLLVINLLSGDVQEPSWDEEVAVAAEDRLYEGVRRLAAFAQAAGTVDASPQDLPVASNPRTCAGCPFRRPCRAL